MVDWPPQRLWRLLKRFGIVTVRDEICPKVTADPTTARSLGCLSLPKNLSANRLHAESNGPRSELIASSLARDECSGHQFPNLVTSASHVERGQHGQQAKSPEPALQVAGLLPHERTFG